MFLLQFILCMTLLLNFSFGFFYPYKSKCKVIGESSLLPLYESNKNPSFLSLLPYFKIGNIDYKIGYCECYTNSGNCIIELDYNNNKNYYKSIIEYSLLNDIKNKTYENVINDFKVEFNNALKDPEFDTEQQKNFYNILKDYKHDPENAELYFSNSYVIPGEGKESKGTISVFNSYEDIVGKNTEIEKMVYPLYYSLNLPDDNLYYNHIYPVANFIPSNIVECISSDKEFKNGNITKNIYTRKDFNTIDIDCAWGNSTYTIEERFISGNSFSRYSNKISLITVLFILSLIGLF